MMSVFPLRARSDRPRFAAWPALTVMLPAAALLGGCGLANRPVSTVTNADQHSLAKSREALNEGEAATALGIASGVLAEQPHNVNAMVSAGDAQLQLGERTAARKSFENALAEHPHYLPALIGLAKLKMRDDIKGAEADFRAIVAANPRSIAALNDLGATLDLQDRHQEAQAQYARALAISPDHTPTLVNLALSLALSGQPVRAEQMLRDATDSGPASARVRANYAVAQVMAGHPEEAERTLQQDLSPEQAHNSVQGMQALLPPAAAK